MQKLIVLTICILTPSLLIGAAAAGAGAGAAVELNIENRTLPEQIMDTISNALSITDTLALSLQADIEKFQKQLSALDNAPHFKKLTAAQQKKLKADIQEKIKRIIDMAHKLEAITSEELEYDQA